MNAEQNTQTPKRLAGPAGRAKRFVSGALSNLLTLAFILTCALWLRLSSGPVDLGVWIPFFEEIAGSALPGVDLKIGAARFDASAQRGRAEVVLSDVRLSDEEAGPFAKIPEISARFRFDEALNGNFAPRDVSLTGIGARLVRDEAGRFRLGLGGEGDDEAGDGVEVFRRLLQGVASDDTAGPGDLATEEPGRLRLRLRDAGVLYIDRLSNRTYRAEGADIGFSRGKWGVAGRAALSLTGGRYGDVNVRLRGRRAPEGGIHVVAEVENAGPADIGGQITALDWMAAIDAPVGGRIEFRMDKDGELQALNGRLGAGAGAVRIDETMREPLRAASLAFTYEPESRRFQISKVALDAERAGLSGAGFVQVNRDGEGAPQDIVAQLDFKDINVHATEFFAGPLAYDSGRFTGRVSLDPLLIEIGELRLAGGQMRVDASGRLWPEEGGWRADIGASAENVSVAQLLTHWPRIAAPGAREWVEENMEAGLVEKVDAAVRLGGEAEAMKIDFSFRDGVAYGLRPMPPVLGAAGSGQVDLERFAIIIDQGYAIAGPGAEAIQLSGSTFVINDLNAPQTPGTITLKGVGRIADALQLIDHQPLGLTSKLGVPLDGIGGNAVVRAEMTIPLIKDLLLDEVDVDVDAVFSEVALTAPGLDLPVTSDELHMLANTRNFTLSGDVKVSDAPATIEWTEVFSPSGRSVKISTVATPARLKKFGMEQRWFRKGRIPISATLSPGASRTDFDVTANLTGAAMLLPQIGWEKGDGSKGSVSARGFLAGKQISLNKFSFTGGGLTAIGAFSTDRSGNPERLRLDAFRFGRAVDIAGSISHENGEWRGKINGPLIDLAGLDDLTDGALTGNIEAAAGREAKTGGGVASAGGEGPPFRFQINLGELRALDAIIFTAVSGDIGRSAEGVITAKGNARVAHGAGMSVDVTKGPAGGRLSFRTDDAGRMLRDAGFFEDGAGGVVTVKAEIEPGDDLMVRGEAKVRDLVIHKDAKLERMLSGAELEELQEKMQRKGIVFDKIDAPFAYGGKVLTLDDAVAKGPSIGINISGDYDIEADRLKMKGVFTPLYSLNSALGKIPLLGTILTGGDGQGMFAFTFSVNGSAEDPDVRVNPLSVLAPGILRRIFSGGSGGVSVTPGAAHTDR